MVTWWGGMFASSSSIPWAPHSRVAMCLMRNGIWWPMTVVLHFTQFHEKFLWRKEDTLTCCVFLRNLVIYSITVPHMYKFQVHPSIFCELLIIDMFSFLLMLSSDTSFHISFNIWNCYAIISRRILLSIPDLELFLNCSYKI